MAFSLRPTIKSGCYVGCKVRGAKSEARVSTVTNSSCFSQKDQPLLRPKATEVTFCMWPNLKPGWVNIDWFFENADLRLDLREGLPFPDDSASIIYSEHFLEHLGFPDEVFRLLRESWRVLMPEGIFSLGIPDFEFAVNSYARRDPKYHRIQKGVYELLFCSGLKEEAMDQPDASVEFHFPARPATQIRLRLRNACADPGRSWLRGSHQASFRSRPRLYGSRIGGRCTLPHESRLRC
jgi:SAM-dependent methyltransferase